MRLMGAARTRAGFLARVALLFTEIPSAGRLQPSVLGRFLKVSRRHRAYHRNYQSWLRSFRLGTSASN
uniref:Putative secreted protein n=1 Tax=Anopheles darlingi TaxID=43151 RepID=A0A2M4D2A7_ANODA